MKIINGVSTKFEELEIGDLFGVSSQMEVNLQNKFLPYLNIKVTKSYTEQYKDKESKFAFNSIALDDGRVRSFFDGQTVYKFDKFEVYL
jgi:hypothetical protein